jgi:mitochondrial intermembrane space import and assembly protein 40
MQECFRKYPEIYGAELQDDEEAQNAEGSAPASADGESVPAPEKEAVPAEEKPIEKKAEKAADETLAEKKTESKPETTTPNLKAAEEAVPAEAPKKFSDATDANKTA